MNAHGGLLRVDIFTLADMLATDDDLTACSNHFDIIISLKYRNE